MVCVDDPRVVVLAADWAASRAVPRSRTRARSSILASMMSLVRDNG